MRGVPEDRCHHGTITPPELKDRDIGVYRPCGPHHVVAGTDPVNGAVRQEEATVLADSLLTSQSKEGTDRAVSPHLLVGFNDRLNNGFLYLMAKGNYLVIGMDAACGRSVMGVGAVDQDVLEWNARAASGFTRRHIQILPGHHEHVESDNRDAPPVWWSLHHDGHGSELIFLAANVSREDRATDDHIVGGLKFDRGSPGLQFLGNRSVKRRTRPDSNDNRTYRHDPAVPSKKLACHACVPVMSWSSSGSVHRTTVPQTAVLP